MLPTDDKDRERIRHHLASPGSSTRRRRRGWRPVLGGDQQDVIGLAVERQRLGTCHGLHRLGNGKAGRAVLLHDSHRSVALRAECLHCRRIEDGAGKATARSAEDRALAEPTYFAGLRKAGMPEE